MAQPRCFLRLVSPWRRQVDCKLLPRRGVECRVDKGVALSKGAGCSSAVYHLRKRTPFNLRSPHPIRRLERGQQRFHPTQNQIRWWIAGFKVSLAADAGEDAGCH